MQLVLVSIAGTWLFLYFDSIYQRRKAESLFAELKSLDFATAGFPEVRDIMIRNGGAGVQRELLPRFPGFGDPMVDMHGNVTFERRGPTCTPRDCTFQLSIMTRLPRIPSLDRTARVSYIRLFLISGSVRGLPMRGLRFETESWIEAKRGSGKSGWNAKTAAGTGTWFPPDMRSRLGETRRASRAVRAVIRTTAVRQSRLL